LAGMAAEHMPVAENCVDLRMAVPGNRDNIEVLFRSDGLTIVAFTHHNWECESRVRVWRFS
jgi:hypothetical protein